MPICSSMAPPNLPGYYWDPDQNRYFKVQPAKAAPPPQAPWSSASVKRRKTEEQTAKKARRRKHQVQRNIKRSPVTDLWTFSGPLGREIDGGRCMGDGDVQTMSWAGGLEAKGTVRFGDDRGDGVHLGEFVVEEWVESQRKGLIWATTDEQRIQCSGMQTNKNGAIRPVDLDFDDASDDVPTTFPRGGQVCDQISSINRVPGTGNMIVTSRAPACRPRYYVRTTDEDGLADSRQVILDVEAFGEPYFANFNPRQYHPQQHWTVNTMKLAPPSSALSSKICGFLATSRGVVYIPHDYVLPRRPLVDPPDRDSSPIHTEILAIDFQPGIGNGLALAAGRGSQIFAVDVWGRYKQTATRGHQPQVVHGSAVSNMKFVNEYQVLAAGPRSKMALYDLRYVAQMNDKHRSRPVLTFPGYNNSSFIDLGLDVSPDGHTVVAAQDDGGLKVFSTSTGTEVACPALQALGTGDPDPSMVRKIVFGKEKGDLYVGLGGCVKKFGFGSGRLDCV